MIMQVPDNKYMYEEICEAAWDESSTQGTNHLNDMKKNKCFCDLELDLQ